MPFVTEDDPNSRFCVSAYRSAVDKENEEGPDSYYSTLVEAQAEFDRLAEAGKFFSLYLYEWVGGEDGWETVDEWLLTNQD